MSAMKIADKMNCSKTTILNHLRKMNNSHKEYFYEESPNRDFSRQKLNIDLQEIVSLHNQGLTDKEIGEKFGCSRHNITARLNRAGYINRKQKADNIELRNAISQSLRKQALGKNNSRYVGLKDSEDNILDYYRNRARGLCKTYRGDMLRNNAHKCTLCGEVTNELEMHHIRSLTSILNDFLSDVFTGNTETFSEELLNYQPFTDENNIILVCKTCHKKFHSKDNSELSNLLMTRD